MRCGGGIGGVDDGWARHFLVPPAASTYPRSTGHPRRPPDPPTRHPQTLHPPFLSIFAVLGRPDPAAWPELPHLPHWAADVGGVATCVNALPPGSRLGELLASSRRGRESV